ncbi:MAG: cytochrome b/b6 domain-containing protein [Chitinophagaceae bacterium]
MIDHPAITAQNEPIVKLTRHPYWVRITHWLITLSFFALVYSGVEILMVHPRLYWGDAGNDLTPALFELPISRNYQHNGWDKAKPFFAAANSPVSASRTYEIFNENGWGRSLHFLSGWLLVITGLFYLVAGIFTGYFKRRFAPRMDELNARLWITDFAGHFRKLPTLADRRYGVLQKYTYIGVILVLFPAAVMTGMTMSPAITAAYPFLLKMFAGAQSARTIHFFVSLALVLFLLVHVVMVGRTGFKKQMRSMTIDS